VLEWIQNNWLALYGALIGTVALIFNFSRFIHTVNKDKIKLALSIVPVPNQEAKFREMSEKEEEPWNRSDTSVFTITVRNIGNVEAYIENVWVICTKGTKYSASTFLERDNQPLKPRTSGKYNISLSKGQKLFEPKRIFVTDKIDGKWKQKV
jgi:hypothetical protein